MVGAHDILAIVPPCMTYSMQSLPAKVDARYPSGPGLLQYGALMLPVQARVSGSQPSSLPRKCSRSRSSRRVRCRCALQRRLSWRQRKIAGQLTRPTEPRGRPPPGEGLCLFWALQHLRPPTAHRSPVYTSACMGHMRCIEMALKSETRFGACRRPSTAPQQQEAAEAQGAGEGDGQPSLLAIQGQRYEFGLRRPSAASQADAAAALPGATLVGARVGMSPSRRPSSYAIADCLTSLPPSPAVLPVPPPRSGRPTGAPSPWFTGMTQEDENALLRCAL